MGMKRGKLGVKRFVRFGVLTIVASVLLLPALALGAGNVGQIAGVVTGAGGTPLANVRVDAYASIADYGNGINNGGVAIAETGGDGAYTLSDLPAGSYLVVFNQGGGGNVANYATDFYPGQRSISLAQPVAVTAGATTPDINAQLAAPGQISGKITSTDGVGLPNILVDVYATADDYQNGIPAGGYHAAVDGTYQIGNLHEGSYLVVFNQLGNMMHQSTYETQFYHLQPTIAMADAAQVTAGNETSNIDAVLHALVPTSKEQCKHGGWQRFTNPTFQNQGQCVRYVEHQS